MYSKSLVKKRVRIYVDKNQVYCLPGQKNCYKNNPKPKPHINTFQKDEWIKN